MLPTRSLLYPRSRPNALSRAPREAEADNVIKNDDDALADPSVMTSDADTQTVKAVPWFVEYNKQFDEEFPLEKRATEPIPKLPPQSPAILEQLATYMTQDLLLKDLSVLDLRDRENPWGSDTIMLLCTAKSERQLRSSAESLKGFLRGHGSRPHIEGLIKWENTKVKRRRRRKMIGRANYQVEDDRLKWLFMEVGNQTGIILQLFSEEGRQEYALEELWQGRANNEVVLPKKLEPMVSKIEPFPIKSASEDQMSRPFPVSVGPLSRRLFSTMRYRSALTSSPI